MKVLSISLSLMTQQGLMGYFEKIADSIRDIESHKAELVRSKSRFLTETLLFDGALKPPSKSYVTKHIQLEDEKRREYWTGLRFVVRGYMNSKDEELKEAARKIAIIFDTYGDARTGVDSERSAKVTNLLQDIRLTISEELIEQLGITLFLEELENTNKKYRQLVMERKDVNFMHPPGYSTEKRKEVIQAYRNFTELLNVFYRAYPELYEVTNFIEQINKVIEIEKPKWKAKKNRLATKTKEESGKEEVDVEEKIAV